MRSHVPIKMCTTYGYRSIPAIISVFLLIAKPPIMMGKSIISDITTDIKSVTTGSTSGTSSSSSGGCTTRKKWNAHKPCSINANTFTGANVDLTNKVFIVGAAQASKYDEAYKALVTYFGSKFESRVSQAFEQKDTEFG